MVLSHSTSLESAAGGLNVHPAGDDQSVKPSRDVGAAVGRHNLKPTMGRYRARSRGYHKDFIARFAHSTRRPKVIVGIGERI